MSANRTAQEVLDREYLPVRAKILEIAAALDRIDRAAESSARPERLTDLRAGIELLLRDKPGRAELIQRHFSLEYEESWRAKFGLETSSSATSPGARESVALDLGAQHSGD